MYDEELAAKGAGPLAIIVCKSSREVQRVTRHCRKMLNSAVNPSMTVVEAFGARDIPKACVSCLLKRAMSIEYLRVLMQRSVSDVLVDFEFRAVCRFLYLFLLSLQ